MDRIERILGWDSGVIAISFECEEKLIYNASALVLSLKAFTAGRTVCLV